MFAKMVGRYIKENTFFVMDRSNVWLILELNSSPLVGWCMFPVVDASKARMM